MITASKDHKYTLLFQFRAYYRYEDSKTPLVNLYLDQSAEYRRKKERLVGKFEK